MYITKQNWGMFVERSSHAICTYQMLNVHLIHVWGTLQTCLTNALNVHKARS